MNPCSNLPEPRPFSIGLTGGIGSGKTTVAKLFGQLGAIVIDTDSIAHQLSASNGMAIAAIRASFGPTFITQKAALDRVKMREHIFHDPDAYQKLTAILHPLIRHEAARAAAAVPKDNYCVFVVPLLVESEYWPHYVSRILVVDCCENIQIERAMQRNTLSRQAVEAIMAAQAPRAKRLATADDVIENNLDMATLMPKVEQLHAFYQSLVQKADSMYHPLKITKPQTDDK